MITVTFPEWWGWLVALSMTLYAINCVLDLVIWHSKRKINKLRGER